MKNLRHIIQVQVVIALNLLDETTEILIVTP
jgi:hypothetical protein